MTFDHSHSLRARSPLASDPLDRPTGSRRPQRRFGLVSHSVIAFAAFGAALAHGHQVRAQEAPVTLPPVNVEAQQPSDYKVDESASPKLTAPLVDTPKTITVIPKELIQERGATSLMDVLRTVPGVSLGAGEGGVPAGDRAFIRGFDSRGDTFIDGTRDFGTTIRDPFNFEQVEVVKGPGSVLGGRGTTGGAINIISKTPTLDDFSLGSFTLGTDATKRGTIDINRKIDDHTAVRINLLGHDADVAGRDAIEQQRWGFAPSVAFGIGTPTQVTLSYYHIETDGITDYGIPFDPVTGKPAAVDRSNFYGFKGRDKQTTSADIGTVRVEHRFSDSLNLRNQTRYGVTTNDYIATLPSLTATPPGEVLRNFRSRDENNTILSNQTDLTSKFNTGSIGHTVVTGLELSRETYENKGRASATAPNADRFNPDYNDPFPAVTRSGNDTASQTTTVAVYAFDTIKFTEQWELSGGIRGDWLNTDVTAGVNGDQFSRDDFLPSYFAGLVYKPASNGSVYFSYGNSYNTSAEFGSLNVETVLLDPEKNNSYEIGTKWDLFGDRLSLTGAVFRTEKTNARVNDAFGISVLQGESRVDGIEIGFAGNITREWKVFGGYTYLKSEIVDDGPANSNDGNEIQGVAPHNFSLWTTYQIGRDWQIGGGALYTGKRFANAANTQFADGYWRFDAMASYHLTQNVDLRDNLLNITDEEYYDGLQSGRANIAPARTLLFTTDAKF
jgi:catecholate siderophore receptor